MATDPFAAAVGNKRAAELFGLTVRAESIEDDPRNTTRFLVLGRQFVDPSGKDKTSLALMTHNRSGAIRITSTTNRPLAICIFHRPRRS